ncbi:hypothetical protein CRG98_032347 [Punica granatum]|uniref:Uncharacterized protein n=1 Tax=Punica granatum TaxID=22663 RepID=A0A2I0ITC0_PUNGR|nr:hypothetical protein CRG98_032347 [Punica granatum]
MTAVKQEVSGVRRLFRIFNGRIVRRPAVSLETCFCRCFAVSGGLCLDFGLGEAIPALGSMYQWPRSAFPLDWRRTEVALGQIGYQILTTGRRDWG